MTELFIREGDLEATSEKLAPVASEIGASSSLSDMPEAERQGMPGIEESGLDGLARDLKEFMDSLATRLQEVSDDCIRVAEDFANVDEAFEREFEVTIGDQP